MKVYHIIIFIFFQILSNYDFSFAQNEIIIGSQTWSSKNLDVSTFRNGDPILHVITAADFERASKEKLPAYFQPKEQSVGKLYNFYAVSDPRGLIAEGWHVSTRADWEYLIKKLGDNYQSKIKSTSGWAPIIEEDGIYCKNCRNWSVSYRNKVPCHVCKDKRFVGYNKKTISGNGNNMSGISIYPREKIIGYNIYEYPNLDPNRNSRTEAELWSIVSNEDAESFFIGNSKDESQINVFRNLHNISWKSDIYLSVRSVKDDPTEYAKKKLEIQEKEKLNKQKEQSEQIFSEIINLNMDDTIAYKKIIYEHLKFIHATINCLVEEKFNKNFFNNPYRFNKNTNRFDDVDLDVFTLTTSDNGWNYIYKDSIDWNIKGPTVISNSPYNTSILNKPNYAQMFQFGNKLNINYMPGFNFYRETLCSFSTDYIRYYGKNDDEEYLYKGMEHYNYYANFFKGEIEVNVGYIKILKNGDNLKISGGVLPEAFNNTLDGSTIEIGENLMRYLVVYYVRNGKKIVGYKRCMAIN